MTAASLLAIGFTNATGASATPGPVAQRTATGVTADVLPTAQINGVVWAQTVVGNTVYVGGSFTAARPAGAAAGTNLSARSNLMAYTLSTGVMTSWAPSANGQILAMTLSPNGQRLYVAGDFTTINGVSAQHLAAFDTSTGALVTAFAARTDAQIKAITATNSTVYVGGGFSTGNGVARSRLAAFSATNGALQAWNPGANVTVFSMTVNPSQSLVIVGGAYDQIAGTAATGLAALDPTTGARVYWAATDSISDWGQAPGTGAAIYSLSHDDTNVYGTGYNFYGNGNLEGTFSANGDTGVVKWVEDCHGDTYGAFASGSAVYTVSHAHYCGNIGGYPQTDNNWAINMRHALAFTPDATGTINHDTKGYPDFYGTPSPSLINWFPEFYTGTYTGQGQAAWSITGNSQYVVAGGEFPSVNGTAQQGLVRFAVPSLAPKKQGPRLNSTNWNVSVRPLSSTTARVSFSANWDRDDENLSYQVVRSGKVVYTTTATSQFWNLPTISFTDTGLTGGSTYTYYVKVLDPDGNAQYSANNVVTIPTNLTLSQYATDIYSDGAINYWRLDESTGNVGDLAGTDDMAVNGGVTRGAAGAINGDADTADTFNGSDAFTATQTAKAGPNTFSEEMWFKTTTQSGGKIVGFGDKNTGTSGNYDRHTYMNPDGTVTFGVYNNGSYTVTTPNALNDGQWHYVVGSLSASGVTLYVDGKRIGTNAGTTVGQSYSGYWRVGGDSPWNGNAYFNGSIDEVAIYPAALSLDQVRKHYVDSGRSLGGVPAPTDTYGKAVYGDQPDSYFRLNESSGTTAVDSSGNSSNGVYSGTETLGAPSPVAGSGGSAVTFDGNSGTMGSAGPIPGPSVYSEELWFKTTTTNGGKLIGFGNQQTGNSSSYDRHVYMDNSGQLTFGTYTGVMNTITSPNGYNDGQWHYVVASQGSDGMKLYVDNQLVGSSGVTGQQAYNGYWRVGGDTSWAASNYFAGTIDEAAVYSSVLTPTQIAAHYNAASAVNHAPTAAFDATTSDLKVNVIGSGSTDSDGTVASYSWNFGDGSTATGATSSHTYTAGGTYTVTLTVTDNGGATGTTTKSVTVAPAAPNQAPTAAFTSSVNHLAVAFDAGGSQDTDGTVSSYSWDFGDGSVGTGKTPSHTYGSAASYIVVLTVTDNDGATDSVTHSVTTLAANRGPTAAFTSSVNGLVGTFDGSGSSDPDGNVASYAWTFGDGGTSTSQNPSHTYTDGGTYAVTLTVTDNEGATDSVTHNVTATAPVHPVVVADTFNRTVASSWGSAATGGAWTKGSAAASQYSANGQAGLMTMTAPGNTVSQYLNSVSELNLSGTVDISLSAAPTGGGMYAYVAVRHTAQGEYRIRIRVQPTSTALQVTKVVGGTETVLATASVAGLVYNSGDVLRMKFDANGSGTTTLTGKVWKVGGTEPATWQVSTADTTAALQSAGTFGLIGYLASGAGTASPLTMQIDNLSVTRD